MSSTATPNAADESAKADYAKASTPSRGAIQSGGKKGKKGGDKAVREKPDFIAPEPKNAAERRDWDRMSTRMEAFHSYFRTTFQQMWEMSDKFEASGITLRQYLDFCEDFEHHLAGHHGIEERHIFPILAKRLPEFNEEHPEEHKKIHEGVDLLTAYINKCKASPKEFSSGEFRKVLASFGPVLMYHLHAEVKTLAGENLRRYYTLEEVRRLPM